MALGNAHFWRWDIYVTERQGACPRPILYSRLCPFLLPFTCSPCSVLQQNQVTREGLPSSAPPHCFLGLFSLQVPVPPVARISQVSFQSSRVWGHFGFNVCLHSSTFSPYPPFFLALPPFPLFPPLLAISRLSSSPHTLHLIFSSLFSPTLSPCPCHL